MSVVDILVTTTDPVTALLLLGIAYYCRSIREDLRTDLRETRDRVERLESELIDSPSR